MVMGMKHIILTACLTAAITSMIWLVILMYSTDSLKCTTHAEVSSSHGILQPAEQPGEVVRTGMIEDRTTECDR